MTAPKPVIRFRNGRWVCRGAGHSGSSRSPVAAYCAWQAVTTKAQQDSRLRVRAAFMAAMQDVGRVWL